MEGDLDFYEKKTKDWKEFSEITSKNLQEIENAIDEAQNKRKSIEATIQNVKQLSKHPQAKSYLQICNLGYIKAMIRHTGEYNIELNPEYQCTLSAEQTVEFLGAKLAEQTFALSTFQTQKEQLQRRLDINFEDIDDIPDTKDMPNEICSDKGVAFKKGSFYEIIEGEPNVPYCKCKNRISRIKSEAEIYK